MHHWRQHYPVYVIVGLVLVSMLGRIGAGIAWGCIGVFLLIAIPGIWRSARHRQRHGVRVPITITHVFGGSAVAWGGYAMPNRSAYCDYDFDGHHYSGVMLYGSVPRSPGPAEALVDPAQPGTPFHERSPIVELTLFPVLLLGFGCLLLFGSFVALTGRG